MSKKTSIRTLLSIISYLTCLVLIYNIFMPIRLNASIQGPSQPEYTGFEPAGSTRLVDEFTGQFVYNIPVIEVPGPQGSSFPLSISYHSGQSPNSDASWVGYGWTLNPGAIIRNTKGFPDDYKGTEVTYINKPRQNITVRDYVTTTGEFSSQDDYGASLSIQFTETFNTLGGITKETGFQLAGEYDYFGGNFGFNSNGKLNYGFSPSRKLNRTFTNWISSENSNGLFSTLCKDVMNSFFNNSLGAIDKYFISSHNAYPMVNQEYEGKNTIFTVGFRINEGPIGWGGSASTPLLKEVITSYPKHMMSTKKVYGYMYSGNVEENTSVMDYYCENESNSFSEKDKYLPIPFSNNDIFVVNAPGLSGSFRFWNKNIGKFRPNETNSNTNIYKGDFELNSVVSPSGGGAGGGFNGGQNSSSIQGNNLIKNNFAEYGKEDNAVFATFINDRGSSLEYSSNDALLHYHPDTKTLSENISHTYINKRSKSKFVGFNLNNIQPKNDNDPNKVQNIELYCPLPADQISNTNAMYSDADENTIKEFNIVNANGVAYTFGLPVYSRNEYNISYGLNSYSRSDFIDNKWFNKIIYLEKEPDVNSNEVITGTIKPEAYANSYLLTSITGANYVDVDFNGVTQKDLGSWTKFNYHRAYGGNDNEWFKWRQPYTGLYYNRGSKSDLRDDIGSYTSGEKEVYYLESIETKTHKAFFITNKTVINQNLKGSDAVRKDGYPASMDEKLASKGSFDLNIPNQNKTEYLEKIVLFSKDREGNVDFSSPIKTVNFQYDYTIWPDQATEVGKLTLKRIWFEYGDEKPNRISPYQFSYAYQDRPINYSDDHIKAELPQGLSEKPYYDTLAIDSWGQYNPLQKDRYLEERQFQSQKNVDYDSFDESAWQLKRVVLPTGGEINVQYESNTYNYVQNKKPKTAFVLMDRDKYNESYAISKGALENYEVAIDLKESIDGVYNIDDYVSYLKDVYTLKNYKVYFKILYKLWENKNIQKNFSQYSSDLSLNHFPNVDYVEGYCSIVDLEVIDNDVIKIELQRGDENDIIPNRVAKSMVRNNKNYLWFDPQTSRERDFPFDNDNQFEIKYFDKKLALKFEQYYGNVDGKNIEDLTCTAYYTDYSFLRLPLPEEVSKKGGGLRVKRIIMVDQMNPSKQEVGKDNIYGLEYQYEDGVASSEPLSVPVDNSLREHIQKNALESSYDDWLAGRNFYIYEGPFGETLLPSPSVSYGKVTIKPLFSGITNPHIQVKEFNTFKDYPFFISSIEAEDYQPISYTGYIGSQHSDLQSDSPWYNSFNDYTNFGTSYDWKRKEQTVGEGDNAKKDQNDYKVGFGLSFKQEKIKVAQGFRYLIQNMHGTLHKERSLILKYDDIKRKYDIVQTGTTEYSYFHPGDKIPIFDGSTIKYEYPGKQQEIVFETRKLNDSYWSVGGEVDFTLTPPFITFTGGVNYAQKTKQIEAVTSSSIVSYPAIVKEVQTTSKEGLTTKATNVAFDAESGNPIITRITDEYHDENSNDGKIYSISMPANKVYSGIGQKSLREGVIISSGNGLNILRRVENNRSNSEMLYSLKFDYFGKGKSSSHAMSVNNILQGDIIKVFSAGDQNQRFPEYYNVKYAYGDYVALTPILYNDQIASNVPQDAMMSVVDVKIIKSIKKNILGTSIGNLSIYQDAGWIDNVNNFKEKIYHPDYSSDSIAKVVLVKTLNTVLNKYKNNILLTYIPSNEFTDELDDQINDFQTKNPNITISKYSKIKFIDFEGETVSIELEEICSKITAEHLAPLEIFVGEDVSNSPIPSNPHVFKLKVARDISNKISNSSTPSTSERNVNNDIFIAELNSFLNNLWTYRVSNASTTANVSTLFSESKLQLFKDLRLIRELYSDEELNSGKTYKVFKANVTNSQMFYDLFGIDKLKDMKYYPFLYDGVTYTTDKDLLNEVSILYAVNIGSLVSQDDFNVNGDFTGPNLPTIKIIGAGLKIGDPNSSEWLGYVDIPTSSLVYNGSYTVSEINRSTNYETATRNFVYGDTYSYTVEILTNTFPTVTIGNNLFKINSTSLNNVVFGNTINEDVCEMILSGSPGIDLNQFTEKHNICLSNDPVDLNQIHDEFLEFFDQGIEYFKIDENNHGLLVNTNVNTPASYFHPTYSRDSLVNNFTSFGDVYKVIHHFNPIEDYKVAVGVEPIDDGQSVLKVLTSDIYVSDLHACYTDFEGLCHQNLFYIARDITPLEFAHKIFYQTHYDNVLSASAVTLKDIWSGASIATKTKSNINLDKGRWHVNGQYYFRNKALNDYNRSNVSNNISPKTSFISNLKDDSDLFTMIPWQFMDYSPQLNNWKMTSKNIDYTLNGQILEVEDMLQNKSCTNYIYNDQVALYTATFADRDEVFFTSFDENGVINSNVCTFNNYVETLDVAHTGKYSSQHIDMDINIPIDRGQFALKFWVSSYAIKNVESYNTLLANIKQSFLLNTGFSAYMEIVNISICDKWVLITCNVSAGANFNFNSDNINIFSDCYFDDIALYPLESKVGFYVYNLDDLTIDAVFDNNHFATLYNYNSKKELISIRKETYQGIKTISTSSINIPKIDLFNSSGDKVFNAGATSIKEVDINQSMYLPQVNTMQLFKKVPSLESQENKSSGTQFDLLDMNIGPNGIDVNIFKPDANNNIKQVEENVKDMMDVDTPKEPSLKRAEENLKSKINSEKLKEKAANKIDTKKSEIIEKHETQEVKIR